MYWAIPDIDLEKCVFRKQPKEKFVLILNMNQKDPDYLLFSKCRLFFKKSIKMLLWIWLVLKCQDTIYPKRLPSRGAKSWMWGGFAWPKRWSSKFSIDAVIFSRMLPHDLLTSVNSFFFLGKIWHILYGGSRARWYKIQLRCLQRLHKTQGFWIGGNLYAAVLATARLIVPSDGMT